MAQQILSTLFCCSVVCYKRDKRDTCVSGRRSSALKVSPCYYSSGPVIGTIDTKVSDHPWTSSIRTTDRISARVPCLRDLLDLLHGSLSRLSGKLQCSIVTSAQRVCEIIVRMCPTQRPLAHPSHPILSGALPDPVRLFKVIISESANCGAPA